VGKPAGYGYTDTTDKAILVSIDPATLLGTYDETNFHRFDLVLADACKLSTLLCTVSKQIISSMIVCAGLQQHST